MKNLEQKKERSLFVCLCPSLPARGFYVYSVDEKLSDRLGYTKIIYSQEERGQQEKMLGGN